MRGSRDARDGLAGRGRAHPVAPRTGRPRARSTPSGSRSSRRSCSRSWRWPPPGAGTRPAAGTATRRTSTASPTRSGRRRTGPRTRNGQQLLYDTSTLRVLAPGEGCRRREGRARSSSGASCPSTGSPSTPGSRPTRSTTRAHRSVPIRMPQYHSATAERAAKRGERASAYFEQGTKARETGDHYLRNTVLLATVLFLTALAQKFKVAARPPVAARRRGSAPGGRPLLRGHVSDDLTKIILFG